MKNLFAAILVFSVFSISAAENKVVWKNLFPGLKTIAICAPGLPGKSAQVEKAIANLRAAGYKVKVMPHARDHEKRGNFVHWKKRLSDFEKAYNDPEVDAIWCVRGGNKSIEVALKANWEQLRRRKIPVIGFSNITALHCVMQQNRTGHIFSGPSLTQMLQCNSDAVKWFSRAIAKAPQPSIQLKVLRGKACSGYAAGGHLTLYKRAYCGKYCVSSKGKIIFLETPRGKPHKYAEKELEALRQAGCFNDCTAVVFGDIKGPAAQVRKILADFTAKVKCPVFYGFPYGHQPANYLIDFEREISISADGKLQFKN